MAAVEELGVAEKVVMKQRICSAKDMTFKERFRDSLQEHAATGSRPWTQGGNSTDDL